MLRLYNTLTKEKDELRPIDPSNVRMYVCGPTVYDFAHIGNARPVIVFDVLYRLLRHLYGAEHVTYVRNITDVDDKINARAARDYPGLPLNEAIRRVTEATDAQFQADVTALGCLPPTEQPRATEYIGEMRAMIERLVERRVAYVAEGHVLFSPTAMDRLGGNVPRYGALARRSLDEMLAGARVDVAPYKREPMDFVLWKPSAADEPGWPSPAGIAGKGRPGWHIECSAMSMAKLLEPFGGGLECTDPSKNVFDIHGGGIDLVFPHHENEIAQSCCAFDTPRMANIWMHNGFLQVEGEKMSKSVGNFVTIRDVLARLCNWRFPGEIARFNMLKTHYRQPIDWTEKGLIETAIELDSLRKVIRNSLPSTPSPDVLEALSDDLNMPRAIAAIWALAKEARSSADVRCRSQAGAQLAASLCLLGFDDFVADATRAAAESHAGIRDVVDRAVAEAERKERDATAVEHGLDLATVSGKIDSRLEARRAKDFAEADRIRAELDAMGVALKDAKDPATGEIVTTWEVKR